MKHLLEYDDPELDSLLGDLQDLTLAEDRAIITFYLDDDLFLTLRFPEENKTKGPIRDEDIITCLRRGTYESELVNSVVDWSESFISILIKDAIKLNFYSAGKGLSRALNKMSMKLAYTYWPHQHREKQIRVIYTLDGNEIYSGTSLIDK